MFDRNALESSNENSLIVDDVIDAMSEHSAAQAQLSSRTHFFLREGKLLSPFYLIRRCVIAANVTNDVARFRNSSNLFTRV